MVKERNPIMVLIYSMLTCGIYSLYWSIQTKNEINEKGGDIPTAWLLIIPIANFYWYWRYVEDWIKVTNGYKDLTMILLAFFLFSPLAIYWIQEGLNTLA
ncbi:MAG: DUF4234 domain-containing protein [Candidatus Heimdallarchaeota archaeon]